MKHDKELNIEARVEAPDGIVELSPVRPLARVSTSLLRTAVSKASFGVIRLPGSDFE